MSGESDVSNIIAELTKVNAVEEGFSSFLVVNPEEDAARWNSLQQDLAALLKRHQAEAVDAGLKQLAHAISVQVVHFKAKKLFRLLHELVTSGVVPARKVCDVLLANEKLSPMTNEYYWNGTFQLIHKIISDVDYKGVREVMKVCLEKAQLLPASHSSCLHPQVTALQMVLEKICDRNECLLPAYFVVNEIQKMYPDNRNWPHWSLAPVLMSSIDSFRPLAQMLSVIGRPSLLPIVDHSLQAGQYAWKMEHGTLKFSLKGNLPYDKEYTAPQTNLIKYVLKQPYSRGTVLIMLDLQKQHKQRSQERSQVLEQQMVEILVETMEEYEKNGTSHHGVSGAEESSSPVQEELGVTHWMWHHLSSQTIYFVLFQFASFPHLVNSLHEKLMQKNLRKGRDHLMWVLLQFVSGSIQKNPLAEFLPVLKLFDFLYPEKEPFPVPDISHAVCVHQMAATCIWMHLAKKAVGPQDQTTLQRAFPNCLKLQFEFLLSQSQSSTNLNVSPNDYRLALLCNAYSTTPDILTRPMNVLLDTIQKSVVSSSPLALPLLDSLTVHSKMSLIHGIVTGIIKSATMKTNTPLPPALVETYSRLLVYVELELLGIKGFIGQLLPAVFKPQAWVILHTLLEMFSYRLHHVLPQYRVQLLSHLHSLAELVQSNQTQLNLCIENAALRLIMGLGSAEFQHPHLNRLLSDPKSFVWKESEELNRAFILTLARTISITGIETSTWCGEILRLILQATPHTWSPNTLNCFPPAIAEQFTQCKATRESKQQLKNAVDQEYSRWSGMNNESEIVNHFAMPGTPPLFLCIVWRMLLETGHVNPIAYTVLDRIGARALSSHVRYFCDFLVYEFANSGGGQHVNKFVEIVNDIVWKFNIVTIDKLILCLALRPLEGNEAQVCFYIIQLLLLKPQEFRNRVHEFVKEHSPDHWKQNGWHDKHQSFLRKYPEKFGPDNMADSMSGSGHLPVYFGNVCLRFLPVFDIVIHRYIEIPSVAKSLDSILDHLGGLYKFHDRPMTYLYQSLHYYDKKLSDRLPLKRRIASFIFHALKDVRPKNWCFTEAFQQYLNSTPRSMQQQGDEGQSWQPDQEHFVKLLGRLVDTINGKSPCPFPQMDWRFNEFPNLPTHALYVTAVEILALPVAPSVAGAALIDTVMKGYPLIERSSVNDWINAIGLIMAALPESYWGPFYDRCAQILESPVLTHWPYKSSPFQVFNWKEAYNYHHDPQWVQFLAICHSIWHHATPGQISGLPNFVSERLKPLMKKEEQVLFLFHMIGPSLQRLHTENVSALVGLTLELYAVLEQVDRHSGTTPLKHMDMICDLLYHIKYMFTGDQVKASIEPIIKNMRPLLRARLRYITHLSVEEIRSSNSSTSLASGTSS